MKTTNSSTPRQRGMPIALWALAVSIFAIGTNEVVMIGLLTTIAEEFSVSVTQAGWIVTSYAIGVAVGGPIVTALTSHVPRKRLLSATMLLFVLSNIIAAGSDIFWLLIVARVLSGVTHGVFIGIGANIASSLVAEEKRATAIAIMFTGLTVAMVTGVPIGTYIGQHFGWRITFGGIAGVGLLCFLTNTFLLPQKIQMGLPINIKDLWKILKSKPMLLGFSLTLFSFAGLFGTFTYFTPLLEEISGFNIENVTWILLLYGAFVAVGNILGGRLSNSDPIRTLRVLFIALGITLIGFYFFLPYKIPTLVMVALMGLFGFGTVPGMQLNVIQLAEKHFKGAEDVTSVLNIAAFNFGIALGSYAGGAAIASSLGLHFVPIIGAAFAVAAIIFSFIRNHNI